MTFETAVSVLAVGFTVSFAWPQVFRALRHGVDGISVGAITQSLVSASAWFGYGVAHRLPAVMLADIGVISGQFVVTVLLVRHRALAPSRAAAAIAAAVALIALSQVDALTTPIVLFAGVAALTSTATQLLEVIRHPHRLEGLSGGAYLILTLMALIWMVYGFQLADPLIIGPNLAMLPMSSIVTWKAWRAHHEDAAIDTELLRTDLPPAARQ